VPKSFLLTRETLDGYLAYQRRMVQVYSQLVKGPSKLEPKRIAPIRRPELTPEREAALEKLASEEERARTQSGLSTEDLRAIEQIVREVIGASTAPPFRRKTPCRGWRR